MKKICIIGGSGTGKTTLSNNIGKLLNLPVYHIDGINYHPNWVERDRKERDKMILDIVKKDKWVIDGTYHTTLSERLKAADLVIYLDYPTFTQIRGVLGRYLKNKDKEKEEIPGCNERMSFKFFIWVLNYKKNKKGEILEKLSEIDKNKVLVFKNRNQMHKWYKRYFGKKYEY